MKKNFTSSRLFTGMLLIAGFLLTASQSSAQSFKILPEKYVKKSYNLENSDHEIYAYIENVTMNDIQLKWKLMANTLDTLKWDYSLCDNGNCYNGIPAVAEFPVTKPGEQASLKLAIAFTEGVSRAGTGMTQFLVYNADDTTDADTVTFVADAVAGIFDIVPQDTRISIYPNPATDVINIVSTDLDISKGSVSIYNALGAKINEITLTPSGINSVAVSQLPAGVYYVRFQGTAGDIATRTFLKR